MPRPIRRHTPTHADGRPRKITFGQSARWACGASWSTAIAATTLRWMRNAGRTKCGCPTSSRGSSAKAADHAAPTFGRTLSGVIRGVRLWATTAAASMRSASRPRPACHFGGKPGPLRLVSVAPSRGEPTDRRTATLFAFAQSVAYFSPSDSDRQMQPGHERRTRHLRR